MTSDLARYPDVRVDIVDLMKVDAWAHLILRTVAALRVAGVAADEITAFRREATEGQTLAAVGRWVTIGGRKKP